MVAGEEGHTDKSKQTRPLVANASTQLGLSFAFFVNRDGTLHFCRLGGFVIENPDEDLANQKIR